VGNSSTVTLAIAFSSSFAGVKNIFSYAADATIGSGWQNRGTFMVR
jgi:hypothetical protein